jgi:hypothetical protein
MTRTWKQRIQSYCTVSKLFRTDAIDCQKNVFGTCRGDDLQLDQASRTRVVGGQEARRSWAVDTVSFITATHCNKLKKDIKTRDLWVFFSGHGNGFLLYVTSLLLF